MHTSAVESDVFETQTWTELPSMPVREDAIDSAPLDGLGTSQAQNSGSSHIAFAGTSDNHASMTRTAGSRRSNSVPRSISNRPLSPSNRSAVNSDIQLTKHFPRSSQRSQSASRTKAMKSTISSASNSDQMQIDWSAVLTDIAKRIHTVDTSALILRQEFQGFCQQTKQELDSIRQNEQQRHDLGQTALHESLETHRQWTHELVTDVWQRVREETKDASDLCKEVMDGGFARENELRHLASKMEAVTAELASEMSSSRRELQSEMQQLRESVNDRLDNMESQIDSLCRKIDNAALSSDVQDVTHRVTRLEPATERLQMIQEDLVQQAADSKHSSQLAITQVLECDRRLKQSATNEEVALVRAEIRKFDGMEERLLEAVRTYSSQASDALREQAGQAIGQLVGAQLQEHSRKFDDSMQTMGEWKAQCRTDSEGLLQELKTKVKEIRRMGFAVSRFVGAQVNVENSEIHQENMQNHNAEIQTNNGQDSTTPWWSLLAVMPSINLAESNMRLSALENRTDLVADMVMEIKSQFQKSQNATVTANSQKSGGKPKGSHSHASHHQPEGSNKCFATDFEEFSKSQKVRDEKLELSVRSVCEAARRAVRTWMERDSDWKEALEMRLEAIEQNQYVGRSALPASKPVQDKREQKVETLATSETQATYASDRNPPVNLNDLTVLRRSVQESSHALRKQVDNDIGTLVRRVDMMDKQFEFWSSAVEKAVGILHNKLDSISKNDTGISALKAHASSTSSKAAVATDNYPAPAFSMAQRISSTSLSASQLTSATPSSSRISNNDPLQHYTMPVSSTALSDISAGRK